VRFLTTYAPDIKSNYKSADMLSTLVHLLAFALSSGENFLPDPASYDDLFYKLTESGDVLVKFRDAFGLKGNGAMQTLINVSEHYHSLLADKGGNGKKNLSPMEVSRVITQGYETLEIGESEGLDRWEKWREGERKALLKRIARCVVEDAGAVNEEG
jgi:hypothetical protein